MRSRKPPGSGSTSKAATPDGLPLDEQNLQPGSRRGNKLQLQDRIGTQLKAVYDELLDAPIPDRFVELLDKLERGGEHK